MGEVLVRVRETMISLYCINTTTRDTLLTLSPLILENLEILNLTSEQIKEKQSLKSSDIEGRLSQLVDVLNLEDLNKEEGGSLLTLISKYRNMLENNKIVHSDSPYNSPVWVVPKKPDPQGNKRWRMVINYRALNEKTVGDAYPLPNIIDILDQLGGAKYFTVLDIAVGFHQIEGEPGDRHKTAFSTPFGHYEFNGMPFGMKNAPATFKKIMDRVLSGLQGVELFIYIDDIVIYAKSLKEHNTKLEKLLGRLKSANLVLQLEKFAFLRKEIRYLEHILS